MVELTVELNAKLQSIHRGEMFEEPLENVLIQANVGEVLGVERLCQLQGRLRNVISLWK